MHQRAEGVDAPQRRAPEKTSKLPARQAASISTSAGSSKYSTPLAATPTPTLPTQATPGQRCAQRGQQGLGVAARSGR